MRTIFAAFILMFIASSAQSQIVLQLKLTGLEDMEGKTIRMCYEEEFDCSKVSFAQKKQDFELENGSVYWVCLYDENDVEMKHLKISTHGVKAKDKHLLKVQFDCRSEDNQAGALVYHRSNGKFMVKR